MTRLRKLGFALAACYLAGTAGEADQPEDSHRVTPTVHVVRKTEPAVAAIFSQGKGRLSMGSGSLVHESGYVLTNDHVVAGLPGIVLLRDHEPLEYRIVGRMPEKDLCLLRVSSTKPFEPIPLGRSNDLMTGEPILCAGNPGGRGIVYSSGIVSSPNFFLDAPNALIMRHFGGDARDRYVQFDAASNQGNSGGPLINALGEQVAVVSNKNPAEENINFAIPIDRVRRNLNELFAPEIRKGFATGLTLDPIAAEARILRIEKDSAAAKLDLLPGDQLQRLDEKPLRHALDWLAALMERKPGDEFNLTVSRDDKKHKVDLKLAPYRPPDVVKVNKPKSGLLFRVCHGNFARAPNLDEQTIVKKGVAKALDVVAMGAPKTDGFAVELKGFLKIPADGVYRLILNSDDGSLFRIGGKLIVNNDGPHPAQDVGVLLRLRKGFLPIRIDYFESTGDAVLDLRLEDATGKNLPTPPLFFHEG